MNERRDTPLARALAREIAVEGPIGVDRFMHRCLADPEHGYYVSQSGIGRSGDFITAPEISQVFGELVGLWAAVVWQAIGAPHRMNLVELGPGRGVLMHDALRAARVMPGFIEAIDLHLVEINPLFRSAQAKRLTQLVGEPSWHSALPELGDVPAIIIANEFLDTLPSSQWQRMPQSGWCERRIGVDEKGELQFVSAPGDPPFADLFGADDEPRSLFTYTDFTKLAEELSTQARRAPMAALFFDYGHTRTTAGDTLQAVRNHRFEHPLASPGEADISVAVDFAAFARAVDAAGLIVDGPVPQGEFLGRLGIAERASRLMSANPPRANEIESGIHRLMAAPGMGTRFQAVAIRSHGLPGLPGFDP